MPGLVARKSIDSMAEASKAEASKAEAPLKTLTRK